VSQIDDVENFLLDRLNDEERALNEIELLGPVLIKQATNIYLDTFLLPSGVENTVAEILIGRLRASIEYGRKVLVFQRVIARELGSPDSLRASAQQISAAVSSRVDALVPDIVEDSLDSIGSTTWIGKASESYTKGFDGQALAVQKISELSKGLENCLNTLADALDSFFSSMLSAAASLLAVIAGLVIALATFETIVGAVVGVVVAIVGVVGVIANISQIAQGLGDAQKQALRDLHVSAVTWRKPRFITS